MSTRTAGIILVAATALVAWMSEILIHAVDPASKALGMTDVFVGVVLVAIIGNAAEHSSAVLMAMKNQMDLAYHIAVGSSMQIALFVAPLLVFVSYAIGRPMDLLFTDFEVITVALSVGILELAGGVHHLRSGILLPACGQQRSAGRGRQFVVGA
jgi:Ca2+:H+ antiporter